MKCAGPLRAVSLAAGHLDFSEGNREVKRMKIDKLGRRDEKEINKSSWN
jgi:hypothetical protein